MKLNPNDLIPLVYFLGTALGEAAEVALVDLRTQRYLVVCHGIDGRQAESDYHLPAELEKAAAQGRDWAETLDRTCTACFLRNQEETLIGLLTIRRHYGALLDAYAGLGEALASLGLALPAAGGETEQLVDRELERLLSGREVENLSVREKKLAVAGLEEAGVFRVKGAVHYVAECLGVSAPTVYRYLKKMS